MRIKIGWNRSAAPGFNQRMALFNGKKNHSGIKRERCG
jgi:hypothetical protein